MDSWRSKFLNRFSICQGFFVGKDGAKEMSLALIRENVIGNHASNARVAGVCPRCSIHVAESALRVDSADGAFGAVRVRAAMARRGSGGFRSPWRARRG